MSYTPTTWVEKVTKVGPTNLNKLENGLQAAAAVADSASALAAAALPTPAGSNGQFLKKVGGVWVPTSFAASDIPSFPSDSTKALLGDGSWAQIADAQVAAAAAIKGSKLATGLNGPPGAEIAYAEFTSSINITGTASNAATDIVSAGAFTFDGVTRVCIEVFIPMAELPTTNGGFMVINLQDGSTELGWLCEAVNPSAANPNQLTLYGRRFLTPSNASHTYKATGWVSATTGTPKVDAGAGGTGTRLPGYIRITKA